MIKRLMCLQLVLSYAFVVFEQSSDSIPELNQQILAYVNTVVGKKVDRGECWDLANQALSRNNADWKFPTTFGKLYNPEKQAILPGDLVQFSNVKIKNKNGETWTFPKHTAIVMEVRENGVLLVAEQNVNEKKVVQLDVLEYKNKVSGKIEFYRPQKKL